MTRASIRLLPSGLILPAAALLALTLRPGAARADGPEAQNVKVLKGLSHEELDGAMDVMATGLGVKCTHCHVRVDRKWEWDKDDKEAKLTARKMIEMTMALNKTSFGGKLEVSCFTCHQGHLKPTGTPPVVTAIPAPAAAPTGPGVAPTGPGGAAIAGAAGGTGKVPPPSGPTVDQVLSRYHQALGPRGTALKLKTRVLKGTATMHDGRLGPLEIVQKAPGRQVVTSTAPQGAFQRGSNGTVGWMKMPNGMVREIAGADLPAFLHDMDFFRDVDLKKALPGLVPAGKDRIGDREVVVLAAVSALRTVRVSFDAGTGLLARRVTLSPTPVGYRVEQVDFDDWRDVGGVKEPFQVRTSTPEDTQVRRFSSIEHDTKLDDALFEKPAGK